jgi:UDP-hydrolysing UDP-N-acetyl-D-glucosamine 2-epimerase
MSQRLNKKKIAVVVGSRANYSSIKSAMAAIKKNRKLELVTILYASAVIDKFGNVSNLIKKDGFKIDHEIFMLVEGESNLTMAKSTGLGLIELSTILYQEKPDIVVTVGDRFETMATAIAAAYMNIPLAHTMGGEVSGTIDESIRHAITKFSHIHFPASLDAYQRILKLGENKDDVYLVGCPRIDLVKSMLGKKPKNLNKTLREGVGHKIDINKPFVLISQHPVTTEYDNSEEAILNTLEAVKETGHQAICLWPNSDAGSDLISRGIRKFRENNGDLHFRFFKNLPIDIYVHLMSKTLCLVGNSSSGIREGAFIGTPVVNIGSRQNARERGENAITVPNCTKQILDAINKQVKHGRYKQNHIYGDGSAGDKIAKILNEINDVKIQKQITY